MEYETALLQREIGWNARYIAVRHNAGLSFWLFFTFILVGTIFFELNTEWPLSQSLLFTIYTITTVGYGNHEIPSTTSALIFISFYIFIGIALLTILAAQLYQWIVLELNWLQYQRDSRAFISRNKIHAEVSSHLEPSSGEIGEMPITLGASESPKKMSFCDNLFDFFILQVDRAQAYKKDPSGQFILVMLPISFFILFGAIVVGSVEHWGVIESLYFAIVSMTTVGFGDYFPQKHASTWFCILWLPFSVGFFSLYLGNIANIYIQISEKNVKMIEERLRFKIQEDKNIENKERAEAIARGTSGGFHVDIDVEDPSDEMKKSSVTNMTHLKSKGNLFVGKKSRGFTEVDFVEDAPTEISSSVLSRRQMIMQNSTLTSFDSEEKMKTMRDVIDLVHRNTATPRRSRIDDVSHGTPISFSDSQHLSLQSSRQYKTARGVEKGASFALRVLLQERFCLIIAHEIAGFQSQVDIKQNTLRVTIDSLKQTCEKWSIPRMATKSFRAVAFEVLYFCGERNLIVRGVDAVFDLRPYEVQGLFAPLLAAYGDADAMDAWLSQTHSLATYELKPSENPSEIKLEQGESRRGEEVTQII